MAKLITAIIRRSIATAALALLLAASASAADVSATITVNTPLGKPAVYHVTGPDGMTLERALQTAKISYSAAWYPSVPGYAVLSVSGFPPITTTGLGTPFWWICVNGKSAQEGISTLKIADKDQVEWSFTADGKCPKD